MRINAPYGRDGALVCGDRVYRGLRASRRSTAVVATLVPE